MIRSAARSCARSWLPSLLLSLATPALAAAQVLTGTVRDSASGGVVPGAVVTLLGPTGAPLRRAVTDERGAYRLASSGGRRVQVLRIGFRPRAVDLAAGPATRALDLRLEAVPTLLSAVEVVDQPNCPRHPERARALALWEQARSALLATVVARDATPVIVRRLMYYRVPGERRRHVLMQTVTADSARGARPFAAAYPAARLVREGFRVERGDHFEYYGPDADVLLDEAFAAAYCFRLARPDRSRPRQAGLAFEPAARRSGPIDIEGTLWVDTTARALAELTFRYVDLLEGTVVPGGYVSFHTMPNSVPIIDRWSLRLGGRRQGRKIELHETGGELSSVRWEDGTEWRAALGTVRGRLARDGQPVARTGVRLAGTAYAAVTDDSGRFEIDRLLPGRYTLALVDTAVNAAGYELTREQGFVAARDSTTHVTMDLPTELDLVSAKCPTYRQSGGALAARVRTSIGEPASGAQFTLWRDGRRLLEGKAGDGLHFFSVHDGAAGDAGAFFVCNLPRTGRYRVSARLGGETDSATFEFPTNSRRLAAVSLMLGRSGPMDDR